MRRGWLALVIVLALVAGLSLAPACRAEKAAAAEEHTAGHAEGGRDADEGNPFGKALDLAIWTFLVFLLLVYVLGKFAWKPMIQGLDQRERSIHDAMEEAKRARDEAQRVREELQRQMDHAQEKVRGILDEGRRAAERSAQEMLDKAHAQIQADKERLHREVELARDQALQQIWSQTANLATLAAGKIIRRQLNPDDQRQLVDEALGELSSAGAERRRNGQ